MDNLNKSGEKVAEADDANPITLLKNPCKGWFTQKSSVRLSSKQLKSLHNHSKPNSTINP